ncbi:MAG: methyltransferase domain-containing protein [Polyangiaceae bacterium]
MDRSGTHDANRAYSDAFSAGYEAHRGDNDPGGYHDLLDELEAEYVKRYGAGRDVLEVGCGTGLVLSRIGRFARSARGVDLSPGMLEKAKERGLDVVLGSATALPFEDNQFDVTCSFKVLAHVPEIQRALSEMARVTRPGGVILAEFYNPYSMRYLLKRFGPAGRIAASANESHVFTRFDSPFGIKKLLPEGTHLVGARGVRIVTPTAKVMRSLLGRRLFRAAEFALCDSPLRVFAGFYVAAIEKRG